ncbi:MAG: 50S ribosomal protein L11 methyltransferase [Chitinophagales bacterium]
MEWREVRVTTSAEAAEAVAFRLERLGCQGVVLEEPGLLERRRRESPLDLFPEELRPAEGHRVTGYLAEDGRTEGLLAELRTFLCELPGWGLDPGPARVEVRRREDTEWADAWKRYYHTLKVGRLVVRPSWEEYQAGPGELVIDLDPGMAFGTGTHPTTALCLAALEEALRETRAELVVDAGTGSGILAIAAAKLGAGRVIACDLDPVACRVARENIASNGVAPAIEVREGDARPVLRSVAGRASVVVANIVAEVIAAFAPDLTGALRPGGLLLAAGIIEHKRPAVEEALLKTGVRLEEGREQDGWVLLKARQP